MTRKRMIMKKEDGDSRDAGIGAKFYNETITMITSNLPCPCPRRPSSRMVPPEILARIFWFNPPVSIQLPANYTQVCSFWRAVARTSPEIWTTLIMEAPSALHTQMDVKSFEAALTDWISCSSDLSIDLTVHDWPSLRWPSKRRRTRYTKLYKRVVLGFSNKWRRLVIPNSWDAQDFLSELQIQPSLNALEELTLSVPRVLTDQRYLYPPFSSSKNLHRLHINITHEVVAYPFLETFISETVNVLTVKSVHGLFQDFKFLRAFLRIEQLQNITHMSLSTVCWLSPSAYTTFPATTLTNLRELVVFGNTHGLSRLLRVLTLPSLVRLGLSTAAYLSLEERNESALEPALLSFMKRSGSSHLACGLLCLTLTGILREGAPQTLTLSSLSDILSTPAANTIQELHIQCEENGSQVATAATTASLMEMLRYDSDIPRRQLLPHLTTFSASHLYDSSIPSQSYFADFAHSRWWPENAKPRMPGVARLETLVLQNCRLTETTQDQLRICYEGGLSSKPRSLYSIDVS
ncbi:hypothetical protein F5880DRAFT_702412 [Lentinula raphanica]|nr:hypothetical protein EV360DRAFT_85251 [Lentinula raphanica]KAJ3822282.1 hypothetical protein F5880DRAFT_702412 [Lentinula raphanica]